MGGRGRGRGKSVSFDVQALGFGRGEALPAAILQPPPLFPPQVFKPVPLVNNEDMQYMLALKQEFVGSLRKSAYYMKQDEKKQDIERYTDKYKTHDTAASFAKDWSRFPAELKIRDKKVKKQIKPKLPVKKVKLTADEDIAKTLETLEKKEETAVEGEEAAEKEDEDKDEDDEEEGENLDEEELNEEDLEEETDYATNYFDNGEGYGDDDDGDDEGPVY
ncbi:DNA-directed RNA polymerase III subunit RPC7-like [Dreissena polymorpha]|uniref:DNA-directed RNA polymerase III subunit n=1 Tax=Dreissena polymorpha TaxID=45954 RepID=A0A9D4KL07_DREPO|nr:DNA-directed RNA polymerase III subunit RPC7-like [Dreissena polymorpha]KAH3841581.1 hypothetical protein DPMN_115048 [Dreissena polymorpha]